MMSWLIAPPTHEELPTVSDEKPHGLESVPSDLDEDETLFDPKAMDEQPTQQFAHAKTRDSSTKRLDSSNLSYDESNVEPELDESFSLFADVQPQLPKLSAPDSINDVPRTADTHHQAGISVTSTMLWVGASTILGGLIAYFMTR